MNKYEPRINQEATKNMQNSLSFEDKTIHLLLKPGHYDALYSKEFVDVYRKSAPSYPIGTEF